MVQVYSFLKDKEWIYLRIYSFPTNGSPCWARTSDIMINSHALCQLSYRGIYYLLLTFPDTPKITTLSLSLVHLSFRQLSTFPGSRPPSIIDVKELNFCVRHGNRWILLAIVTGWSICLQICNLQVEYLLTWEYFNHTLKTKQCFSLWFYVVFSISILTFPWTCRLAIICYSQSFLAFVLCL